MLSILYISSMYKEYSKSQLEDLLSVFTENNKKHNITGLMLYYDRNIIQYIEGEDKDINTLYYNINNDKRHKYIIKLFKQSITKRKFPDWKLGYHTCDKYEFISFYDQCLNGVDEKVIINLFESFIKVNIRYHY